MTFGEKIRWLREDKGITQTELGKEVHMTQRKISYMECDRYEPSLTDIIELCVFFRVSADYLLGLTDDDPFLRQRNNDLLTPENQRFLHKLENLLLLDQQRQTKK